MTAKLTVIENGKVREPGYKMSKFPYSEKKKKI